jgi:alginate O-acetyltransferase complex protein AlgI
LRPMAFTSLIFLFFFLPLALAAYLLTPDRYRNIPLLTAGLIFYGWSEGKGLPVVLACGAFAYLSGLCLERLGKRRAAGSGVGLLLLILLISVSIGPLVFFKYIGFVVSSLKGIMESARWLPIVYHVPVGLSFLTFRVLSYIIDVYRGDVKAEKSMTRFFTYATLFPLAVAGPIVRYNDIADQLVRREMSIHKFAGGVRRFGIGLGKKVLVADTIAVTADLIFGLPSNELSFSVAWLGAIAYTLQIYFDFSGYSDMAIGIGAMLGFEFPENFNYPYTSRSVREFWRRWHITLSSWFRDYLYIPLGGNRVSEYRNYLNLAIVFALCGLWHGAGWTFIVWGLWHGIFLMAERTGFGRLLGSIARPGRHVYVLFVVVIGWVLFKSENVSQALGFLTAMSGLAPQGDGSIMEHLNLKVGIILIVGIIGSAPVAQRISEIASSYASDKPGVVAPTARGLIMGLDVAYVFLIMGLSVVALVGAAYNPFIYAGF